MYDGDCGFCTRTAGWLADRVGADTHIQAGPSSDLDGIGLSRHDIAAASWWFDAAGRRYRGASAVTRALATGEGSWAWAGRAASAAPLRWVANAVYALVVRNRHHLSRDAAGPVENR